MLRFDSGFMRSFSKRMSQSVRISTLLAFPFVLILLIYPLDIFNKNAAEFGNHPATLTPFFIAMGTTALVCAGVGFLLTFYRRSAGFALTTISLWIGCSFTLRRCDISRKTRGIHWIRRGRKYRSSLIWGGPLQLRFIGEYL